MSSPLSLKPASCRAPASPVRKKGSRSFTVSVTNADGDSIVTPISPGTYRRAMDNVSYEENHNKRAFLAHVFSQPKPGDNDPVKWLLFVKSQLIGEFATEAEANLAAKDYHLFLVRRNVHTANVYADTDIGAYDSTGSDSDSDGDGALHRRQSNVWAQRDLSERMAVLNYVRANKDALNPPKWLLVEHGRVYGCYNTKEEAEAIGESTCGRRMNPFYWKSDNIDSLFAPQRPVFA